MSLCLSVSLAVSFSVCLSVCRSVCLSICLVSLSLSPPPSLSLSLLIQPIQLQPIRNKYSKKAKISKLIINLVLLFISANITDRENCRSVSGEELGCDKAKKKSSQVLFNHLALSTAISIPQCPGCRQTTGLPGAGEGSSP